VPLVAETGGQNALVVDSSALAEQAVADCVTSAFDSAGQRCSALRLLCVQADVADRLVAMLKGAVEELVVGDPRALATDVGPVIDMEARDAVERHVASIRERGARVWRPSRDTPWAGTFVAPTVIEIDDVGVLEREVFGPVLHVLRFQRERLDGVLAAIRDTGYGLTHGVHTRIDETVATVVRSARAGNVYVNRNIVGAVVGVQPFGGEGLSGTGPKAGGPLYLLRLLAECPEDAAKRAVAGSGEPAAPPVRGLDGSDAGERTVSGVAAATALRRFAEQRGLAAVAAACDRNLSASPISDWRSLPGPTGEANLYSVLPREAVLCLAEGEEDRLLQLAAVLAVGSRAVWPPAGRELHGALPADVRRAIDLVQDPLRTGRFDVALHHGDRASLLAVQAALAEREGPIVTLVGLAPGDAAVPLERLVVERSLSINTAAAGGNASLMTIG
jgi:RHH-type proline utilization regulon transcriptional repressor/proline dehydrogenase/delta 1-pyrroline-5-carboxylate dehydrogenase